MAALPRSTTDALARRDVGTIAASFRDIESALQCRDNAEQCSALSKRSLRREQTSSRCAASKLWMRHARNSDPAGDDRCSNAPDAASRARLASAETASIKPI